MALLLDTKVFKGHQGPVHSLLKKGKGLMSMLGSLRQTTRDAMSPIEKQIQIESMTDFHPYFKRTMIMVDITHQIIRIAKSRKSISSVHLSNNEHISKSLFPRPHHGDHNSVSHGAADHASSLMLTHHSSIRLVMVIRQSDWQ